MHAVTYVKCLNDGEFQENLFCCKELPPINKEQDLFNVVSSYLEAKVLEGLHCYLYRCAPSMVGSVQVLPSFGKKKKDILMLSLDTTFLREVLVSKTLEMK